MFFFDAFAAFFGLLQLELSPGSQRTFFEPSIANSCWSSRARGCRSRREFHSQATRHGAAFSPHFAAFFWAPSNRTLSPGGGHFVPVIVLHEFQQSFEFVVVPQIPFIVRVLDKSVLPQRQVRTEPNCAVFGRLHWCSSWTRLINMPVEVLRQVPVGPDSAVGMNCSNKFQQFKASISHRCGSLSGC